VRLHSLELIGFRRFAKARVNLNEKLVGIVGPNEAGKSSILAALALLNTDDEIPPSARTRDQIVGTDQVVIRARFRLEEEERTQSALALGDDEGIWLVVSKVAGGARTYELEPAPQRDLGPRLAAAASISRELGSSWLRRLDRSIPPVEGSTTQGPADLFRDLGEKLSLEDESLDAAVVSSLESAIGVLGDEQVAPLGLAKSAALQVGRLRRRLEAALEIERAEHPSGLAESIKARVPKFLEFSTPDRGLRAQYNLLEPSDFNDVALRNLAAAAGLSLRELRDASGGVDPGKERALIEAATATINDRLSKAWRQSPLAVSFGIDGRVVRLTISSHEYEFFSLDDRSAGLRMFIALRMFLARHTLDVPPVLLVDEAETHLHYDAQADLIRVFEAQKQATQVVYTTHSIGCLPQDLGRGIRVVVPAPTGTRSSIENVWSRRDGKTLPGASPLLLAMGASTIPLAPSRYVVIAEGLSDAMLGPSLLREATGLPTLGYQIVGGLAEATDDELRRLDLEAPRVAYLLDGDKAGGRLAKRLLKLGIPAEKIVSWTSWSKAVQLEDLLDLKLYITAVNQYLLSWPPNLSGPSANSLKGATRPQALRAWCKKNLVDEPSKTLIAEEVLRLVDIAGPNERTMLGSTRAALVATTHERLVAALGIPATPEE
jgi:predicted ATP-dependent endonuclease of OLD family